MTSLIIIIILMELLEKRLCIINSAKFLFLCFLFFISFKYNKETIDIKHYSNYKRNIKDILFINGCDTNIAPHPYRYRVQHQIEQLSACFLESDEFYYLNFEPDIIPNYRVIIFFRCPWTEKVGEAIQLAKSLNKKVLFDIDDLVIDTKYTDTMPYIKTLSLKEKSIFDDGVMRMGKTLTLCEGAITTTEDLAKELKNYVANVFINRNVASEEMWTLSQNALIKKNNIKENKHIIIGYFPGSITHNQDLEMIKPALNKILKEFKKVKLLLLGKFSIPNFLKKFSNQIIYKDSIDYKELPEIISNVDINLAPIENNIFNAAKSENKWVEAALVKVPTIASNFGAFKYVIQHNQTGLLCTNITDWYLSLKVLIESENLRKNLGENAYNICKKKYNTIQTGIKLANYITSFSNKHIGFFLPSLQISRDIYAILKHACFLQDEGWDVDLIYSDVEIKFFEFEGHNFNAINLNNSIMTSHYDIIVASFFKTFFSFFNYSRTIKHLYIIQNYEKDFYLYTNYIIILEIKMKKLIPFLLELIILQVQIGVKNGYGKI
jgi:glycosyltransferase involved in cell wall biosynthesis